LLVACEEKSATQSPAQIVLIFKNAPINTGFAFDNGVIVGKGGNKEISYFDDYGIKHLEALSHQWYDTIIVKSARSKVEVTHAYRGIDKLCYIFQNGDTALFTYNGQKPLATILNRDYSELLLNYDIYKKKRLDGGDFPEYLKFFNPWLFYDFDFETGDILGESDRVQELSRNQAIVNFEKENFFLDSLNSSGLISVEERDYLKKRSLLHLKIMSLQQEIGFRPLERLGEELSPSDFNLNTDFSLDLENQFAGMNISNIESDIYFNHHDELLDWMLYNYYSRKVGRVTSSFNLESQPGSGSNMPNYMELYDTIKNAQLIRGIDKNTLLLKTMEKLIETSSQDQRKEYFDKFAEDTGDSVMINFLASKYHFDQSNSEALLLVSAIGDTIEFDELLRKYGSKVIYVDFWASWCKPCLKEQPVLDQLEEKYQNESLVFIYISIDAEHERWLASVKKRKNIAGDKDYLVINRYNSKQFEEFNLEYIPRYLLFGKAGELLETFAPRPSDDKLILLLNRYLSETN
jgi:thiol-disulfide isomerase/thioredoxin